MLNGMQRAAWLSTCGTYRWTLTRTWDDRPVLLVVMFNPSTADAAIDDPTITLLCNIAAHNGYGGIVVVNLIPLRSSKPKPAIEMTRWDVTREWSDRDRLQENLGVIAKAAARAGAVLLAWGALGDRCSDWTETVLEEVEANLPGGAQVLCLGKTKAGYPLHPLARGKLKVPKDAKLLPWKDAA
jgi:hypothetical protein